MAKAHVHAASSARRFGGDPEEYLAIHLFLDSSKGTIADNRHRALTHNAWFLREVLPRAFGDTFINSVGRTVSVIDVGEQHVLEDYNGFIPSAQDFLEEVPMRDWMVNGRGEPPPSCRQLKRSRYEMVD